MRDDVDLAAMDRLPVLDAVTPLAGETISGEVVYGATAVDPDVGSNNGAGITAVML